MGNNFIWCADIQKGLKEPLYVDQVHYSAKLFQADSLKLLLIN